MYVYNADTYCDSCGSAIIEELESASIADDGDSDGFPQFSFEEECDYPDHCASHGECLDPIPLTDHGLRLGDSLHGAETVLVGALLCNGLTSHGFEYLAEMLAEPNPTPYQRALHALWRDEFNV